MNRLSFNLNNNKNNKKWRTNKKNAEIMLNRNFHCNLINISLFYYRTSVLFVSISFIVLMIISFVWLVFYYVQRFRYLQTKDRKSVSLCYCALPCPFGHQTICSNHNNKFCIPKIKSIVAPTLYGSKAGHCENSDEEHQIWWNQWHWQWLLCHLHWTIYNNRCDTSASMQVSQTSCR